MTDKNKIPSESIHGTIVITNDDVAPLLLILEPWCDETVIASGKTAKVSFSGPQGGRLEIVTKGGEIVLHGWEASVLDIIEESEDRDPTGDSGSSGSRP